MLLLTLPGTPTTYYGEEIGMENINITQSQIQDPAGKYNLVSILHSHTKIIQTLTNAPSVSIYINCLLSESKVKK